MEFTLTRRDFIKCAASLGAQFLGLSSLVKAKDNTKGNIIDIFKPTRAPSFAFNYKPFEEPPSEKDISYLLKKDFLPKIDAERLGNGELEIKKMQHGFPSFWNGEDLIVPKLGNIFPVFSYVEKLIVPPALIETKPILENGEIKLKKDVYFPYPLLVPKPILYSEKNWAKLLAIGNGISLMLPDSKTLKLSEKLISLPPKEYFLEILSLRGDYISDKERYGEGKIPNLPYCAHSIDTFGEMSGDCTSSSILGLLRENYYLENPWGNHQVAFLGIEFRYEDGKVFPGGQHAANAIVEKKGDNIEIKCIVDITFSDKKNKELESFSGKKYFGYPVYEDKDGKDVIPYLLLIFGKDFLYLGNKEGEPTPVNFSNMYNMDMRIYEEFKKKYPQSSLSPKELTPKSEYTLDQDALDEIPIREDYVDKDNSPPISYVTLAEGVTEKDLLNYSKKGFTIKELAEVLY